MAKIKLASFTVERRAQVLANLNSGLDAIGNLWDESRLGPIERARYFAAIRLDSARDRLAALESGRTGF